MSKKCDTCRYRLSPPYGPDCKDCYDKVDTPNWVAIEEKPEGLEPVKVYQSPDNIEHPSHYTSHPSGVECIDIIEHLPFNIGATIKYLWRCDEKHESPFDDLNKALWFIKREIKRRST